MRNRGRLSWWAVVVLIGAAGRAPAQSTSRATAPALDELLPEARRVDWQPGPDTRGVHLPVALNVRDKPYLAKGDGIADDTAAIQRALDDCPVCSTVGLPAGTYRTTAELVMRHTSVALRGEGPDKTHIVADTHSGDESIIKIIGPKDDARVPLSEPAAKGDRTIELAREAYVRWQHVIVDEDNDPRVEKMDDYAKRPLGQIVKVGLTHGKRLELFHRLYLDLDPKLNAGLTRFSPEDGIVQSCGIEDLSVQRLHDESNDYDRANNITLQHVANCWVRNVESIKASAVHILLNECVQCEVSHCLVHHGQSFTGGRAYGVMLMNRCTDNLVEDNALYYLRHSMVIEWGGCGNVFGYNASQRIFDKDYPNTNWLMLDICVHGDGPFMNLFEGNVCAHMGCDNEHGSSRANTFFRNRAQRYSEGETREVKYNLNAVDLQRNQLEMNVIGNVLCRPGDTGDVWSLGGPDRTSVDPRVEQTLLRHGNFDFVTGAAQWDPKIPSHELPASLYLKKRPRFFGKLPWPAIGPDCDPKQGEIPASKRLQDFLKAQAVRKD